MFLETKMEEHSSDEITPLFVDKDSSFGRKKTTILWAIVYCFLLAGYATLAAAATWVFLPIHKSAPLLLCSCDVGLVLISGIFQQHLVYQVKTIRLQGYYSASQKLDRIVRLPFAITTYGTAAMLLVMVLNPQISILSVCAWLRIIMLIEAVCAASCMVTYIATINLIILLNGWLQWIYRSYIPYKIHLLLLLVLLIGFFGWLQSGCVHQFNSSDGRPDVLEPLESPLQPSTSLEGLRYHDGGQISDQLMALLQYQQGKMHILSEEILRLKEDLSKYEQSDSGSTSQVDLAHMLAARDKELQIRSAEMSELQSKLRLARSTIAERDSEIRRARTTNNQYLQEHDRLRLMLEEWSLLNQKLERELKSERETKAKD